MTAQMPSPDAAARRPAVMVVDDDRLVLLTLGHGLRQAGFEVLEADNGDDAILMARSRRPGLALLDIRMQGLSGFDVAQHLKDYERIPFIFVSAYADEDIRQQAQALGALACLSKPVDMADLVRRVGRALDAGQSVRSGHAQAPLPPLPKVMAEGARGELPASLDASTALALGLLMHRESLDRAQAWGRMQALAHAARCDLQQAAEQLVEEHERLVRTQRPSSGPVVLNTTS